MMNTDPKSILFGRILVFDVGVLFVSIAVVATNLWLVMIPIPGWPVLLAVIFAIVVGKWIARKGWVPSPPTWVSILFLVVGSPLTFYVPMAARTLQLKWIASRIPAFPNAKFVGQSIEPVSSDSPSGIELRAKTDASPDTVLLFFRQTLSELGWTEEPDLRSGRDHYLCKNGSCLSIWIGNMQRTGTQPWWWSTLGDSSTWIQIEYEKW